MRLSHKAWQPREIQTGMRVGSSFTVPYRGWRAGLSQDEVDGDIFVRDGWAMPLKRVVAL